MMELFILILKSYFSLALCWASPQGPDPVENKPGKSMSEEKGEDTRPLNEFNVTEPTAKSFDIKSREFFYPGQQAITFSIGPFFRYNRWPPEDLTFLGSLSYLWYSPTRYHIETGIEGTFTSEGHVWGIFRMYDSTSDRVRLAAGAGLGLNVNAQDGLATFLRHNNYYLRFVGTIEYSFTTAISIRLEAIVGYFFQASPHFASTAGISYGF